MKDAIECSAGVPITLPPYEPIWDGKVAEGWLRGSVRAVDIADECETRKAANKRRACHQRLVELLVKQKSWINQDGNSKNVLVFKSPLGI